MKQDMIRTSLSTDKFSVTHDGQVVYDFKKYLMMGTPGHIESVYGPRRYTQLNIGGTTRKLSRITKGLHENSVPEGFYYYFLVDRNRTGISPDAAHEVANFVRSRLSSTGWMDMVTVLNRVVAQILKNYDNVVTDIPNVAGDGVINLWSMHCNHPDLERSNHEYIKDRIDQYLPLLPESGSTIILCLFNPELAYELSTHIPKSIPITLISKGIYYK